MEKNARKIKPSTIIMCIVSLIYIAGIITVSYFTIDFHNKTLEEKKIIKDKKNELHETKEIYVAPVVKVIEVAVENGFAVSDGGAGTDRWQ